MTATVDRYISTEDYNNDLEVQYSPVSCYKLEPNHLIIYSSATDKVVIETRIPKYAKNDKGVGLFLNAHELNRNDKFTSIIVGLFGLDSTQTYENRYFDTNRCILYVFEKDTLYKITPTTK